MKEKDKPFLKKKVYNPKIIEPSTIKNEIELSQVKKRKTIEQLKQELEQKQKAIRKANNQIKIIEKKATAELLLNLEKLILKNLHDSEKIDNIKNDINILIEKNKN